MKTAILIDGGFFIKRYRAYVKPDKAYDGVLAAKTAWNLARGHLTSKQGSAELYRIFFYDCPPLAKKMHNPITGKAIDFSKSNEALFRNELHTQLLKMRKVALRLGHLSEDVDWTFKPEIARQLMRNKMQQADLTEYDVIPAVRQKGVDMRIGLDITSLALKKQVEQIILVSGDADFVPVAKFARREGIDFILDPMHLRIADSLHQHIDGLHTVWPPSKHSSGNTSFEEQE